MNRNRKGKMPEITREMYKSIGAKKLADIRASIEAVFEESGEDKKEG